MRRRLAASAQISLSEARTRALQQQWLFRDDLVGLEGTQATLEHLGYVQIDSIAVVSRAHHHVLQSRVKDYAPEHLNQLLKQRQAFEYWGHAASYLPLKDYRYYLPLMQRFVAQSSWAQTRLQAHGHLIPEVLKRLEQEGPLKASDFKDERRKGGWWNWKPAKIALELLYWQGQVMVVQRDNFHKVYDLRERFLPADLDTRIPEPEELGDFCLQRALQAHGLMSFPELRRHLPLVRAAQLQERLQAKLQADELVQVQVEGLSESYYLLPESYSQQVPELPERLRILSPFDNLVIQRQRLSDLFAFDYLFEAYVPQAKRRYGYFTLPVLHGARFVARMDCKAERKAGVLRVLNWHPEASFGPAEHRALWAELERFAAFNGCPRIEGLDPPQGKRRR